MYLRTFRFNIDLFPTDVGFGGLGGFFGPFPKVLTLHCVTDLIIAA